MPMKHLHLLCPAGLALSALLALCACQGPADTATDGSKPAATDNLYQPNMFDYGDLDHYAEANRALLAAGPDTGRVVFMGNSITENWAAMHPAFFTDNGYVGRGISGQTTSQMLVRFRQDVLDLEPAILVLHAGINDIAENAGPYSEDRTMAHIQTMVELAMQRGIRVIIASVLPSIYFFWHPSITDQAPKIVSLNARLKAYADGLGLPYVDYYTPMVLGDDLALNPAYTDDGTHPTLPGYAVMEPLIKAAIDRVRTSSQSPR